MNLTKKLIAALFALCCLPAMAGTATGTVTVITTSTTGVVWVQLSVGTGHGSCAGSNTNWVIKDETTVAGKNQVALLMGSFMAGTSVTIYGASTCTRLSGYEDIDAIVAQ